VELKSVPPNFRIFPLSTNLTVKNTTFERAKLADFGLKFSSEQLKSELRYDIGEVNFPLSNVGGNIRHAFVLSVVTAYNNHLGLEISPDDLWSMIALGIAQHLGGRPEIAEKYRPQFVSHKGKKQLTVLVDFSLLTGPGSLEHKNGWPKAIKEFKRLIKENTKTEIGNILTKSFSTTGRIESTVFSSTLMEDMKNYFDYKAVALCGIPQIVLHGSEEDYKEILTRIDQLEKLFPDLVWWLTKVKGHMTKILQSYQGKVDVDWWNRILTEIPFGSGPQVQLTGWLGDFIPYIGEGRDKKLTENKGDLDLNDLDQPAVTLTDITFEDQVAGKSWNCKLAAGFIGSHQDPTTLRIRPVQGWTIYFGNKTNLT